MFLRGEGTEMHRVPRNAPPPSPLKIMNENENGNGNENGNLSL